jgi:hypothetical protein
MTLRAGDLRAVILGQGSCVINELRCESIKSLAKYAKLRVMDN